MPSFVVFLRAINLGARRKVAMADLRRWLAEDGFADVETWIQTGNVKVATRHRSRLSVEQRFERLLREHCGFDVPCMAFTASELRQVYDDAMALEPPFPEAEGQRRYVVFFKDPPDPEVLAGYQADLERAWGIGRAAHIWIAGSFHQARIFNRLAKVLEPGTNRDLKVVKTLAERWGSSPAPGSAPSASSR